jgi:hypothetical protein
MASSEGIGRDTCCEASQFGAAVIVPRNYMYEMTKMHVKTSPSHLLIVNFHTSSVHFLSTLLIRRTRRTTIIDVCPLPGYACGTAQTSRPTTWPTCIPRTGTPHVHSLFKFQPPVAFSSPCTIPANRAPSRHGRSPCALVDIGCCHGNPMFAYIGSPDPRGPMSPINQHSHS